MVLALISAYTSAGIISSPVIPNNFNPKPLLEGGILRYILVFLNLYRRILL
jgi:hypothetical protein